MRIASYSFLGCLWVCCVAAAAPPVLSSDGPVNAASFARGSLAPGSEAVVYGQNLAGEIRIATQAPLPLFLGGPSLYLNGMAAPLLFVSPTQINFQIPWELAGLTSATIVAIVDAVVSNVREVGLGAVAHG